MRAFTRSTASFRLSLAFVLILSTLSSVCCIATSNAIATESAQPRKLLRVKLPERGKRPLGVLLVIHGGGWYSLADLNLENKIEGGLYDRLLARRIAVASVDYRTGAASIGDTLRAVKELRKRFGERTPLCAIGGSAGGHLALITEAEGADYDCIAADAAPFDLRSQRTENPGGDWLWKVIQDFWPSKAQRRLYSPIIQGALGRIDVPTILGASECDFMIPTEDARDYVDAVKGSGARYAPKLWVLSADGGRPYGMYGHCLGPAVNRGQLLSYERARRDFLLRHLLD